MFLFKTFSNILQASGRYQRIIDGISTWRLIFCVNKFERDFQISKAPFKKKVSKKIREWDIR